jgi:hypothetical protein
MKDLVCVAADKNIEAALRGMLARSHALGIRDLTLDILVHPRHDPGCFHEAHEFLRLFRGQYRHALVIFDRAWDGAPASDAVELETALRQRLGNDGWADVVVIDPELEAWVWSDSPWVDECLGWSGRNPDLRSWLRARALWVEPRPKPDDPKAALEEALRVVRLPRSSAIYEKLAQRVSMNRCTDESFGRLRRLLAAWFPRG